MRVLVTLVALAALVGAAPEGLAAKPRCAHLKEHDGCKPKLAGYTGTQASGGPTYGLSLTIDATNGPAVVRGAVRGACKGGGPDGSKQYLPVLTAARSAHAWRVALRSRRDGWLGRGPLGNNGEECCRAQLERFLGGPVQCGPPGSGPTSR